MENASYSATAPPPPQAGEFSPETRPEGTSEIDGGGGPTIKINVSHGTSHHELHLPAQSTFGDVKKLLVHKTGLEPEEQRLFFRGIEKGDKDYLHQEGVKDKSKILLMEGIASKERKLEETRKQNEMLKVSEAIAVVRAEVDKLSDRVTALEVSINGGNKVSEKEFLELTELLMSQLLKLDGIEAEGEVKLQRKAEGMDLTVTDSKTLEQEVVENSWSIMATELSVVASGPVKKPTPEPPDWDPHTAADDALAAAMRAVMVATLHTLAGSTAAKKKTGAPEPPECYHHAATDATPVAEVKLPSFLILTYSLIMVRRVQNLVDTLDSLKARNSNPFSNSGNAVIVTTQWETFDSGMESSNAPSTTSSSTRATQDWERFD